MQKFHAEVSSINASDANLISFRSQNNNNNLNVPSYAKPTPYALPSDYQIIDQTAYEILRQTQPCKQEMNAIPTMKELATKRASVGASAGTSLGAPMSQIGKVGSPTQKVKTSKTNQRVMAHLKSQDDEEEKKVLTPESDDFNNFNSIMYQDSLVRQVEIAKQELS